MQAHRGGGWRRGQNGVEAGGGKISAEAVLWRNGNERGAGAGRASKRPPPACHPPPRPPASPLPRIPSTTMSQPKMYVPMHELPSPSLHILIYTAEHYDLHLMSTLYRVRNLHASRASPR